MAEQQTDEKQADRPMPGPGDESAEADAAPESADGGSGESGSDGGGAEQSDTKVTSDTDVSDFKYGEDETQDFVDRSKIDFDPEDGLYTGTAIEGGTDIPGPHQDEETTGDPDAMAEKAEQMAKDEGTEDKIGEGASGSAVGKGSDGSKDDISGG